MTGRELVEAHPQVLHGRYEIQQRLGKKAGRQTLLARDIKTQQLVIIKLLTFGNSLWEDFKLFEREIETLKSLSHPAIPSYLDSFEIEMRSSKGFAMVQSYIPAKSLEEEIAEGRTFSEAEIKQLAKSLLEILIYLHGFHPPVIHRDLKPSNILLGVGEACAKRTRSGNNVGQVYLVDFGSVQTLASREGKTVTVVGTYGYMPPEQFGGRAVPASDLYSLGATLVALMTKCHPADLPQKDLQIQFEDIEILQAKLDPDLMNWLKWLTEPSLDRRCSSARTALKALEKPRQVSGNNFALQYKKIATVQLFGHILLNSIGMGLLTGAVFGGLFGTSVFPITGTVFGGFIGGGAGMTLGLVNGLILAIWTRSRFFPLRNLRHYQRSAKLSGFISGFAAVELIAFFAPLYTNLLGVIFLTLPIALISGLSMMLTNKEIAEWYEKETRA
jgi:eukaryotic-like serine/threonine-protein kinase